jgi:NAD(P)-dependent dehydrogenase (short-subunit alcohol dehydrogenase family)
VNWIAADILRIEDGVLVEHWDVIQDEATKEQSKSGSPMFGDSFPVFQGERFGTPEEIAQTILFVASGKASFITGASIAVDGGNLAR